MNKLFVNFLNKLFVAKATIFVAISTNFSNFTIFVLFSKLNIEKITKLFVEISTNDLLKKQILVEKATNICSIFSITCILSVKTDHP